MYNVKVITAVIAEKFLKRLECVANIVEMTVEMKFDSVSVQLSRSVCC